MTLNKKLLLSFAMAGMMLFPVLNRIMDTGFLFLLIPFILLGARVIKCGFRKAFQPVLWQDAVWLGVFALFAVAVVLRLTGVWSAGNRQAGEYAVVASVVLLYPALKLLAGWDKGCLQIPVFIGIWVLTIYFIDTALFPGVMLLFGREQDTLNYINMTAFLVILMSSGLYMYSKDGRIHQVYAAGVAVSALVIAVNGAWGTAFMVFVMFVIHSVTIVPVAEIMKRLLQLFFGFALFFCNVSILVHYIGVIHVEGLEYHLECGVAGELFLCLPAIYVFRRWDRIPEGTDLRVIKLARLQKGCRCFLEASAALLVVVVLLSLVDGRLRAADLEVSNLVQLFAGEKWEEINSGVWAVTVLSLFENMYEALVQMWKENIFALFYQTYGWIGAVMAVAGAVLLCRRLYFVSRGERTADDLIVWLAVGSMGALFCLPVTAYMLPVYLMPVFMAVCVEVAGDEKSTRGAEPPRLAFLKDFCYTFLSKNRNSLEAGITDTVPQRGAAAKGRYRDRGGEDNGKTWRLSRRRNARKHEQSDEAGAEDAAPDGGRAEGAGGKGIYGGSRRRSRGGDGKRQEGDSEG